VVGVEVLPFLLVIPAKAGLSAAEWLIIQRL